MMRILEQSFRGGVARYKKDFGVVCVKTGKKTQKRVTINEKFFLLRIVDNFTV